MGDSNILVDFWFLRDISSPSAATAFFDSIEQTLPELVPEEIEIAAGFPRPFITSAAVVAWTTNSPSRWLAYQGGLQASRRRPPSELSVDWSFEDRPHFHGIGLKVTERFAKKPENLHRLVRLVEQVCERMLPAYGVAMHQDEFHEKNVLEHYDPQRETSAKSGAPGPPECLTDLYWLNFLGEPYVEFFGLERLLKAPAHQVKSLGNGLLLLASTKPFDFGTRDVRSRVEKLKDYLGHDAFFDRNRPGGPYTSPKFDFSQLSLPAARSRFEKKSR